MTSSIIFDFGNVFISWDPRRIFRRVIPASRLEQFMQTVWNDDWNNNLDSGISFIENQEILSEKYPQHSEYIKVFHQHWYDSLGEENPASIALLTDLQQAGYATYGLTNWSAETFPPTKEIHPFFDTFTGIVISGNEKVRKPHPEIYRILLERYHLQPQECIFIDDRQENLDTARQLGIDTILFQTAEQVRKDLNKAGILQERRLITKRQED